MCGGGGGGGGVHIRCLLPFRSVGIGVFPKYTCKKPEAHTFAPSFFKHTHERARTHAGLSGGGVGEGWGWRRTYE